MSRVEWIGALCLLLALSFQAWVTFRVWKSRIYEKGQKLAQSKLIWLLPVLGAILVFSVLSAEERAEDRSSLRS
jgi:hypothetical protein